jgi:cob(I)alamin adenosyltransferase
MAGKRQPARASIATRRGDGGTSSLLFGRRVPKDHPQIEAVGALDELNAALGLAKVTDRSRRRRALLETMQQDLVALMGEVACAERDVGRHARSGFVRLTDLSLQRLDDAVAVIEARAPRFDGWAMPGANRHAATLDLARTFARRAERRLVALPRHGRRLRPLLLCYLNRASDLLWLLAREAGR